MSFIGKLFKTTFDVVALPVDVVKDVLTLGGACVDEPEPYIVKRVRKINRDAREVREELEDL